jgi:hypothetical protein
MKMMIDESLNDNHLRVSFSSSRGSDYDDEMYYDE